MSDEGGSFNPEEIIISRLQAKAGELAHCLDNHDVAGAFSVIEHINAAKEESIYFGLGMLARGLHTAIVNFQIDDYGKHYLAQDQAGNAPVTLQLDNVIRMSEEAARKTLNIIDSSMPLAKQLREQAAQLEVDGNPAMRAQREGLEQLEGNLMEILMAQGFQDLSGQAIRKVNVILDTLQQDLVALLRYANQVKSMSIPVPVPVPVLGELEANHPAVPAPAEDAPQTESAMSQDSVDDLLSSLGF